MFSGDRWFVTSCLAGLACFLLGGGPALAQDTPLVTPTDLPLEVEVEMADLAAIDKARQVVLYRDKLGLRVQRYLEKAGELMEAEQPEEAQRLLKRILESRLNPLERSYVYRLAGFVAYGNERPEDAIAFFGKAIDQQAVQRKEENRMRYGIGQLYVSMGEWEKAIRAFKDWQRYTEEPDPAGYYVQSIAYFQFKEYDAAVAHVEKAIELAPKPQEGWLRLLVALHAERQDFTKATPVLEELLLRFPSKKYWAQLSLLYAARESYELSMAVQQLAYTQGFLTESKELHRLAQGYLYHDLPYPAAVILDKELEKGTLKETPENYEMLANSWIAAREYEKALPSLQRAAELADSGTFYVRLGQVHIQREEWPQAAGYLRKALQKGDLDEKRGSAEVLLGIAQYNAGDLAAARSTFQRASGYERNKVEADRWIEHISKELGQKAAS